MTRGRRIQISEATQRKLTELAQRSGINSHDSLIRILMQCNNPDLFFSELEASDPAWDRMQAKSR